MRFMRNVTRFWSSDGDARSRRAQVSAQHRGANPGAPLIRIDQGKIIARGPVLPNLPLGRRQLFDCAVELCDIRRSQSGEVVEAGDCTEQAIAATHRVME